MTHFIIST